MALVGVTEASRLTGKSRATIYRKMKSGELSSHKDGDTEALLETSELMRVFGAFEAPGKAPHEAPRDNTELVLLQAEIQQLKVELAGERAVKEVLQANLQDLRQAMLLLEHKPKPEAPDETVKLTKKQRKQAKLLS